MNTVPGTRIAASRTIAGLATCVAMAAFCGCEKKEKVIDIETPAGKVEVERSEDGGAVHVDVNKE